VVIFSFW